jgi:hypothetical protein
VIGRRHFLVSALGAPAGAKPCVLVVRASDGAILHSTRPEMAAGHAAAPGSAIKPFTLMELASWKPVACPRRLRIADRTLDCTHLPVPAPLDAATALAASCNCWFAAHALTLDAGRFHRALMRLGALAEPAESAPDLQLQALGVAHVRFTPAALAEAYRRLIPRATDDVLNGLRLAASTGTARAAAPPDLAVAGKTGTTGEGAWFAGYAPVLRPEVVVVAYFEAGQGAADAAPAAREGFEWWLRHGQRQ